jgi:integrase
VLARNGYAGCVNDVGFDIASPEPARQPEAVTAGLQGDRNPYDPTACFLRFLPPAIEQFQQRALIDRELLQRRALDARHDTGNQPLMAFRHGLRAVELVDLRWEQVDSFAGTLAVRRAKKGTPSTHPLRGDELRALRRLQRESPESPPSGFAKLVERAGKAAGLAFKAHPHMLHHACGFALANAGHDTRALQAYLGHRNIQHTVRYTELAPNRFKDFWR